MRNRMNVYLSFDIEVWCNGWNNLDREFPAAFERYVYGRSTKGEYALPKTLEVLAQHDLKGVFFVEPLFAARFGVRYLKIIIDLIKAGGHDIELHLHPEWTDEIRPFVFPGATRKRQHLSYYTLEEQIRLIQLGIELMAEAGGPRPHAFRSGSFACNGDTFTALHHCGIAVDSSLNAVYPESGTDLRNKLDITQPGIINGLTVLPMTLFRDGTGHLRPAQVGACSVAELQAALDSAHDAGQSHFIVLSHNFEMLKQHGSDPDLIVSQRFEALCRYLADHPDRFRVAVLDTTPRLAQVTTGLPYAPLHATLQRYGEQLLRRFIG